MTVAELRDVLAGGEHRDRALVWREVEHLRINWPLSYELVRRRDIDRKGGRLSAEQQQHYTDGHRRILDRLEALGR